MSAPEPRNRRRSWWIRPNGRVSALSIALGLATVGAQFAIALMHEPAVPRVTLLPMVAVAIALGIAFTATEGFVIYVRVRRGGHAIGLSEIPMVLGLLLLDPSALFICRMVGAVVGLIVVRRQRGTKLAFNLALTGAQATTAAAIFFMIGGAPGGHFGPRQWIAAYIAMMATDALAAILVTAVICLHDDPGEWRRLPAALRGVHLVVITTSVALVGGLALESDYRAVVLIAVVTGVTFIAYRAYLRQTQGHDQVEQLYEFTRTLDGSRDSDEVARTVLAEARDQMRAEVAELVIPSFDGTGHTHLRLHGQGKLEMADLVGVPTHAWWADAAHGQPVLVQASAHGRTAEIDGRPVDGIAVPVPMGGSTTGVLLVTGSLPDIKTFDNHHVRLFHALANHASVSLAKAHLVDELRQEVADKEHQALHDTLTGLPNRRRFNQLLDVELAARPAHSGRGGTVAVLLMDLDRFKEVNDALGHDVGDGLLREVADRLRRRIGERGVVARLGGDEFAVLFPGLDSAEAAVELGNELAEAMEQAVPVGHLSLDARASIGIALAPQHGNDATTLVQRADVAMYAAKSARSGLRLYQADDDNNSPRRLALIADLRAAIDRREIMVSFQPKMDPRSGVVTGAEALARWHHPVRGFVPPDEFIPLAEHSGLIRPLTLHVLETSLRRCAAWRRAGHDLSVAVNLSPNSLLDSGLPDVVARLLGQAGVPAPALTLEITESAVMSDPTGSVMTLDRLHALGVKLSIDDFGTGYSSLGRLRQLPIHEVKIDKSFVQRVTIDHRDRAVVRSAIQLGHALDLDVVAEGVEDDATLAHLAQEGCNLVQGYFISRPLPAEEFAGWLSARTPTGWQDPFERAVAELAVLPRPDLPPRQI
ncbi:MAG TPA: GGDEF domain-containing protein [Micromonosporaceae bacterium]|nr:GGDEF domain-containing protein [Micromonosporaceae bacterium]